MTTYTYANDLPTLPLAAQLDLIRAFCDAQGLAATAGYIDDDQAEWDVALQARPAGAQLMQALAPGDALVVASPVVLGGRAEFLALARTWSRMGLTLHIIAVGVDGAGAGAGTATTSDLDWGVLVGTLDAAELLDREAKSREIREGMARARREGRRRSRYAAIGTRFEWDRQARRFKEVPDEEELRVIARVVRLREEGFSWRQLAEWLQSHGVRTANGTEWGLRRLQLAVALVRDGKLRLPAEDGPAPAGGRHGGVIRKVEIQ